MEMAEDSRKEEREGEKVVGTRCEEIVDAEVGVQGGAAGVRFGGWG
jgi:hypothetical protein